MKEKRWVLFKVCVYLSLSLAALVAVLFLYNFVPAYNRQDITTSTAAVYLLILAGLAVQIIFNILNVRLLHHYHANHLLPTTTFARWHTLFLVLTSGFSVFLIIGFMSACVDIGGRDIYNHRIDTVEAVILLLFGVYVFFSIYTLVGSILLKRYLKQNLQQEEEQWLSQLGNSPLPN